MILSWCLVAKKKKRKIEEKKSGIQSERMHCGKKIYMC